MKHFSLKKPTNIYKVYRSTQRTIHLNVRSLEQFLLDENKINKMYSNSSLFSVSKIR